MLKVEGENLNGCYMGTNFLSRLADGEKLPIGETAVVIGGGNTAIDCTRNLLRYGAKKVIPGVSKNAQGNARQPGGN